MGLFTKDIKNMNDLFVHQFQHIYYAEQQLAKALPRMAEKATDEKLKQDFLFHLDETKAHVNPCTRRVQLKCLAIGRFRLREPAVDAVRLGHTEIIP